MAEVKSAEGFAIESALFYYRLARLNSFNKRFYLQSGRYWADRAERHRINYLDYVEDHK